MKTHNLIGPALDWAVAKCEGQTGTGRIFMHGQEPMMEVDLSHFSYQPAPESAYDTPIPRYSTDWSQGGPILEREVFEVLRCRHGNGPLHWETAVGFEDEPGHARMEGPTPLIAFMRCYVASKLGDEVEIPEELK